MTQPPHRLHWDGISAAVPTSRGRRKDNRFIAKLGVDFGVVAHRIDHACLCQHGSIHAVTQVVCRCSVVHSVAVVSGLTMLQRSQQHWR